MITNTSSSEVDLESQQTLLHVATKSSNRDRWRRIFLILHAYQVFISVVSNAKKGSLALLGVSPCVTSRSDAGDGMGALEQPGFTTHALPQVSQHVDIDGNYDHNVCDLELQYKKIAEIVRNKDSDSLREFGGVHAFAGALDTDLENGISGSEADLQCRRTIFQGPAQGSIKFLFKDCNSWIFSLLFLSGVLSFIFGIMKEGWSTGWYEGAIILVAVIILVVAPSIRAFWLERSQKSSKQKLMDKRGMVVDVKRDGRHHRISFSEVLLGDIVCLEWGHQVPADGLLVSGEFSTLDDGLQTIVNDKNPFLFYGTKVINGRGRMLVTSVGVNTGWGEMMSRVTHLKKTPFQSQVDKVNTCIQVIGLLISILILLASFLRFEFAKEEKKSGLPDVKGNPIPIEKLANAIKRVCMKPSGKISLTTLLTVLLVGVVEGFPFVLTVAITYWNKKTLSGKAFAKKSLACVAMGSVTKIVTDKTGGLTLNPVEVDMCRIGQEIISEDSVVAPHVLESLGVGISAPFLVEQHPDTSKKDPQLSWAKLKLGIQMDIMKQSCFIVKAKERAPNEEAHVVLIRKNGENGTFFSHWNGPATNILAKCSYYYDSEGTKKVMDGQKKSEFEQTIVNMQSKQLETVAFAYKQTDVPVLEEENLILLGLFGLKKTCWEKTIEEIKICSNAGVSIILVSGDDVSELKKIALKCGLLSPDHSDAMIKKGEEFRNCTHEERMKMVDEISVMGNSLPADRFLLVQCLKQKGHTVAVAGVTTNEIPALKQADVGLAMGTWSSNMARESSDIIIREDSFSFLVTIMKSGRCTCENIQKYIQLELTMFVAGLMINCLTTVSSGDSPITAIQLIWVNLLVAILGGLGLLTDPPTEKLMKMPPVGRKKPLITKAMWRNIVSQTLYQTAIIITFHFKGKAILHISDKVSKTIAFNSFLICQVFNQFNARELEMKNVFKGIQKNKWFWVASVMVTVASQEAFLAIAHFVVGNAELNYKHWAVCILIGIPSWVIDWVTKWTWGFIMNWLTPVPLGSHTGSISTTSSASLEPTLSLELPLISDNSIANPS